MFKLGIIGLSPGNGHPYSWSAIFNGYNQEEMAKCPFPVIHEYLSKQDPATMRIPDAEVTHIWTQDPEISHQVARTSLIKNVVQNMTDMIGNVDAVILARDDGENHLEMAQPFIEAGIPIFIDKPLTDRADDLRKFIDYYQQGKPIMSCSSVRYSPSILALKESDQIGKILTASMVTPKYWRTYGIHLIEGVYAIMDGGIETVQNVGRPGEEIVHIQYTDGRHAVIQTFAAIGGGQMAFFGEGGSVSPQDPDGFLQFKNTLVKFVEMLKTGKQPFDWCETVEMSKVVIAGQMSMDQGGKLIHLDEVI